MKILEIVGIIFFNFFRMLDKKVHIIRTHNFDNKNVSFDENAPLLQDNFASIIKHNS